MEHKTQKIRTFISFWCSVILVCKPNEYGSGWCYELSIAVQKPAFHYGSANSYLNHCGRDLPKHAPLNASSTESENKKGIEVAPD